MTRPRTFIRIVTAVGAISIALTAFLPQPAALAAGSEPPFEFRFPQETEVTVHHNDFGAGRSGGRRHRGNDLMAPKLTAVYAAADGIVEDVGINRRAGRYIRISHGDGWSTFYAHLNNDNPGTDDGDAPWSLTISRAVKVGAEIEAGQLIGWVGDSGNAEGSGSHTHFEIAINGREVNPYYLLREAWERDHARYKERVFYLESKSLAIV